MYTVKTFNAISNIIRQHLDDEAYTIDADAFVVHKSEKYVNELKDIMAAHDFWPDEERRGAAKKKTVR